MAVLGPATPVQYAENGLGHWCPRLFFCHPNAPLKMPKPCSGLCVPVSTAETQGVPMDFDGPPLVGERLSEAACLRFLVKECGWYWLEAGNLKRSRLQREVA